MPTTDRPPEFRPLRRALALNAAFSLLTGLLMILFTAPIAMLLGRGIPPALVFSIGVSLVPFGGLMVWLATRRHPAPSLALVISGADMCWVAGSALVLALAREH